MEKVTFENDIKVFYITANSFPDGIMDAHKKLHTLVPFSKNRRYFGISRPENGVIVYKAAAEELYQKEAEKFGCDTFIIKKGEYIYIIVKDFMKDIDSIGKAFKKLLSNPDIDPKGYCLEWYLNDSDVRCMIRLR